MKTKSLSAAVANPETMTIDQARQLVENQGGIKKARRAMYTMWAGAIDPELGPAPGRYEAALMTAVGLVDRASAQPTSSSDADVKSGPLARYFLGR